MNEAWIQLRCPNCEDTWEENPTDLPAPGEAFTHNACGTSRPVGEFARSTRDFEILEDLHSA
jgi:hypothetical protein